MLLLLRNIHRLLVIAVVIAMPRPRLRRGKRLALAFQKLGPTFIKFGQILSTRPDLIGEDVADDLGTLRDKLPPFPAAQARAIVEQELQHPLETLFREFADTPVAAASIAQVHRAVTRDGRVVAVKILRPGIEKAFARDLDLFLEMAKCIARYLPSYRRLRPVEVVETLRESVFFELDLRFEAAAATELAENLAQDQGLIVPQVDWNLTSRRVLTTSWVEGIPIHDSAAIAQSGLDVNAILTKLASSLFCQVFRDGFFHADLHPGNLFVNASGDIVAVDFGIMGRLDMKSRIYMAEILRGFLTEDYAHVARVHFDAGYVPAHKSIEQFTQACMAVAKPIIGKPVNEISVAKLLGQMFKIAGEFEMEAQPQLLLLQKTMMITEGVGRMLNPNVNMWELARPLVEEWANAQLGLAGKVKDAGREGYQMLKNIPAMLTNFENTLRTFGDPKGVKLHPDSIDTLVRERARDQQKWLVLGWGALVMLGVYMLRSH